MSGRNNNVGLGSNDEDGIIERKRQQLQRVKSAIKFIMAFKGHLDFEVPVSVNTMQGKNFQLISDIAVDQAFLSLAEEYMDETFLASRMVQIWSNVKGDVKIAFWKFLVTWLPYSMTDDPET
eukprot:UN03354